MRRRVLIILPRHRRGPRVPCGAPNGSGSSGGGRRGWWCDVHRNCVPVVAAGALKRRRRAWAARAWTRAWPARDERRVERASCWRRRSVDERRCRRGRVPPLAVSVAVVAEASVCAGAGAGCWRWCCCIRGLGVSWRASAVPVRRLALQRMRAVAVARRRAVTAFAGAAVPIGPLTVTIAFTVTVVVFTVPAASLGVGRRGPTTSVVIAPEVVSGWRRRRKRVHV